jgi:DNA-directed RNA polymerase subunit omega
MARVTVEDCVTKVSNRFELVLIAGQRARQISSGASLLVERNKDKNPVVALREISEDKVNPETLRESIIQSMQRHVEIDEPEEDDLTLLDAGAKASEGGIELTTEGIDKASQELLRQKAEQKAAEELSTKSDIIVE